MFTKLWERYFFREITKIFFFFIVGFFVLYILIDFSSRHSAYRSIQLNFYDILSYYIYIIIQRWEILIPFALLIASIKTLCSLNVHNELVALMASGISLKTLMRPFIILTLLITAFLYFNTEFLIPASANGLRKLQQIRVKEKYQTERKQNVHNISLEDGTILIYHRYDPIEKFFFDTVWMRSANELYRIKFFYPGNAKPIGKFVDHYTRNEKGQLVLSESFPEFEFHQLKISQKELYDVLVPPSDLSLTQLWKKQPSSRSELTDREAGLAISFYRKLALPWLSLLTFMAIAPFCLRFTRQLPVFMLYLGGMAGLVAFYLIINAAFVLGENQVIPPFWAACFPFLSVGAYAMWRYGKLQ